MNRSRLVLVLAMSVVMVGVVAGLGALWMSSAHAAVGPLAGEALILPQDARFVMGFDVKRFAASPFYERFASRRGMKPELMQQLEERTGLNPTRDIDQIVIAGSGGAEKQSPGVAVAFGRFDLYKLGRAIETEGKAQSLNHEGVTVYSFAGESRAMAVAFLDESTLVFGPKERVLAAISSRTLGEAPLKSNTQLMSLVEKVRPGSTFWMVGDQSLLASMPTSIPAPGSSPDAGASMQLPALQSLTVTGDLDPQVSIAITGEARDALAAKNLADVVRGLVAMASLQAQQRPELLQLASAISVATEENRVLVNARVPYETLEMLQPKPKAPTVEAKITAPTPR